MGGHEGGQRDAPGGPDAEQGGVDPRRVQALRDNRRPEAGGEAPEARSQVREEEGGGVGGLDRRRAVGRVRGGHTVEPLRQRVRRGGEAERPRRRKRRVSHAAKHRR